MTCAVRLISRLCVALLFAGGPLSASVPIPPVDIPLPGGHTLFTVKGALGGSVRGTSVEGGLAYLIEGTQLVVMDITDPDTPAVRSRTGVPGLPTRLITAGGFAYLFDSALIWVYDVRDPTRPALVKQVSQSERSADSCAALPSELPAESPVFAERVGDGMLVLATREGLKLFDLQNPASPVLRNIISGSPPYDVQVVGRLVYLVLLSSGVQIWDVGDPCQPALRTTVAPLSPADQHRYLGVALDGSTMYVSARRIEPDSSVTDLILTVDVSGPAQPHLMTAGQAPAERLSWSGSLLVTLLSSSPNANQLRLYDMSSPGSPVLAGSYQFSGGPDYQVSGSRVYALLAGVWEIIDISIPAAPALRGQYRSDDRLRYTGDLALVGSRLYLNPSWAPRILDVSNPLSPVVQESLPGGIVDIHGNQLLLRDGNQLQLVDASRPLSPTAQARGLPYPLGQIVGNLLYATDYTNVQVFDISDPTTPAELGRVALKASSGEYAWVGASEGRVFVATAYKRLCGKYCWQYHIQLSAVDVTDPRQPRLMPTGDDLVMTTFYPPSFAVSGTSLFIFGSALQFLDTRDPGAPVWSSYSLENSSSRLWVIDKIAYVMEVYNWWGLEVFELEFIDLRDPVHPRRLGSMLLGKHTVRDLAVAGSWAYLITDRLWLVDLGDPVNAQVWAIYNMEVSDVAASGLYVYLALGDNGLQIVQAPFVRLPTLVMLPLVSK